MLSLSIFVDFGSQVVLQTSEVLNLVLDNEGRLGRQHKLNVVAERACLVKHVQVAERKAQADLILA